MLRQHVGDAALEIDIRRAGHDALHEGDLGRGAFARRAMIDQRLGFFFAERDPVGADIGIGRRHRRHVDLQHLDAVVLRALEEPGVGLNVRDYG